MEHDYSDPPWQPWSICLPGAAHRRDLLNCQDATCTREGTRFRARTSIVSGRYVVGAVSDGVGSHRYSEVGARVTAALAANIATDEAAERGAKVPTTTVDEHGIDSWPLPNVWLGVSVEDQRAADERIPLLLQAPAAVRFLSCEPLLDWVNLRRLGNGGDALWPRAGGIDWVIVGGESGPDARACKVSWVRDLVRQCSEAGVPAFVKQLGARPDFVEPLAGGGQSIESMLRHGEYEEEPIILRDRKGGDPSEWPEDLRVRQWPEADQ